MIWKIPEKLKERVSYALSTPTLPAYQEGVNLCVSLAFAQFIPTCVARRASCFTTSFVGRMSLASRRTLRQRMTYHPTSICHESINGGCHL